MTVSPSRLCTCSMPKHANSPTVAGSTGYARADGRRVGEANGAECALR